MVQGASTNAPWRGLSAGVARGRARPERAGFGRGEPQAMRRQAAGRRRAQGGPKAAGRAVGGRSPPPREDVLAGTRFEGASSESGRRKPARRTSRAVGRQPDPGQADGRKPGGLPQPAKRVPASGALRGGPEGRCQRQPTAGAMPKAWREGNRNSAGEASSRARTGKRPLGRRSAGAPVRCRVEGAGTANRRGAEGTSLCGGEVRRRSADSISEHAAQAGRTATQEQRCNKPATSVAAGAWKADAAPRCKSTTCASRLCSRFPARVGRARRLRLP
jgi:hypothetical protein